MKKLSVWSLVFFFFTVGCAGLTGGINKKCVDSAKIEAVHMKPDKKGNYYVYITVKNVSSTDRPFYLAFQADDQVPQYTASGKKGQPNLVKAGSTYTFAVNTWRKVKPKKVEFEVKESLR